MNKKIILGIGALGAAILPATAVVACAPEKTEKPEKKEVVAAPAGAIAGYNAKAVTAKGLADGNTYTQAQIDKRDNKVAPAKAVVGENKKAIGDGSGKKYTKAQIDARDLPIKDKAPTNAVVGINSAASKFSDDQVKEFLTDIIDQIGDVTIDISSGQNNLNGTYIDKTKATKDEIKTNISSLATTSLKQTNVLAIIKLISNSDIGTDATKADGKNYSRKEVYQFISDLTTYIAKYNVDISVLSGNKTLLSKKVANNGTANTFVDAKKATKSEINKVLESIEKDLQVTLEKTNVKAFISDLSNVLIGNDKINPNSKIGDGSGQTYTQAQIDARDNKVAPQGAIVGENKKAIGDGTGQTYTQAQIDARDLPSANAAPTNAVVGKNSIAKAAVGDGSGNTYTQAQIDKRDSK